MDTLMDFFEYKNGELFAEDVPVERIAREVGTPAYIYSLATLRHHFRVFDQAFKKQSHLVCFSVKANSNLKSKITNLTSLCPCLSFPNPQSSPILDFRI